VAFPLPYLRIQLVIRGIRTTRWDAKTWPIMKHELAKALRIRGAIVRAGWFN